MKQILALCILAILVMNTGCRFRGKRVKGNGNVITETRSVGDISKLRISSSIDVIVDSGAANIRVEAEENVLPYILTTSKDGSLNVGFKNNISITTNKDITVYLTVPTISDVQIAGSGSVLAKNKVWSKRPMHFDIGGSGDIEMVVNAPTVDGNLGGSGNLRLSGETRDVKINIGGSGEYRGLDLKAEKADVNIAGSGNAAVFADVDLKVAIVGSGDVKYKGNATVHKNVIGSGSISQVQ